jgi:glycosyltransferase involved in cell wall biosynthesis
MVTGIDQSRVTVIMNPKPRQEILKKAQELVTHEWFIHKTAPIIVAVGRLRVQKNFQLLIRAFAKLPSDISARLVIVGSGREEPRLRLVAEEVQCTDRVHFTGYVDNPYAYLAKADCFVGTFLWEGMPNAVLEALVCGTPIIAADCSSGPREILAPDTDYRKRLTIGDGVEYAHYGALYAVNDEAALIEALSRFLTDPALRQKYAVASVTRSKDFESHVMINEYARVLGI